MVIIVSVTTYSQVAHLGSHLSPSPTHVAPSPSSLTCPRHTGILTVDSGSGNRQAQMCTEERGKLLPVCKVLSLTIVSPLLKTKEDFACQKVMLFLKAFL